MKKQKIFFVILVVAAFMFNAGRILFKLFMYAQPKFVGFKVIGTCLLAMVLPLGLSFLLLFKFSGIKRWLKILLTNIAVIAILGSGIWSALMSPFMEIISYTDDINDYMAVDFRGRYHFPEKIPENSANQSYHYAYEDCYIFNVDTSILAKWDLPKDEYEAEKERVLSLYPDGIEKFNEQSNLTDYFIANVPSCTLIFSYSDETNTVQYVFENLSGDSQYVNSVYQRDTKGIKLFVPF